MTKAITSLLNDTTELGIRKLRDALEDGSMHPRDVSPTVLGLLDRAGYRGTAPLDSGAAIASASVLAAIAGMSKLFNVPEPASRLSRAGGSNADSEEESSLPSRSPVRHFATESTELEPVARPLPKSFLKGVDD